MGYKTHRTKPLLPIFVTGGAVNTGRLEETLEGARQAGWITEVIDAYVERPRIAYKKIAGNVSAFAIVASSLDTEKPRRFRRFRGDGLKFDVSDMAMVAATNFPNTLVITDDHPDLVSVSDGRAKVINPVSLRHETLAVSLAGRADISPLSLAVARSLIDMAKDNTIVTLDQPTEVTPLNSYKSQTPEVPLAQAAQA